MRVVSIHIIQKTIRIDVLHPHWHAYQSQAKRVGQINVMRIKLPTVAVCNGPALIRITLMRIQCGRMQRALLRIIMRIVGLVWTGLYTVIINTRVENIHMVLLNRNTTLQDIGKTKASFKFKYQTRIFWQIVELLQNLATLFHPL